MICSCCGYEIKDKGHLVENGTRHVCDNCWNDPEMFFPEKISEDKRLKMLSEMASATRNQNGSIEVEVIKFVQKEIQMYIGKMKVNDILRLYELDKFKEEELEGYQREQYEERTSELVEYLEKCPLAVMPALLVSLRNTCFISQNGDFGTLKIPRRKGSLWIIDGQHRVGGFSKIRDKFIFSKSIDPSLFSDLMDYEFPIVFIDSTAAAEEVQRKATQKMDGFSSEDIERTIFFIVNKTQKGISPSLKDALLYRIKTSGIQGLSLIEKEGWRIIGAELGITLNCKEKSPLKDKINVSGKRETGKPIQLNSFVSSLEPLFKDKEFLSLSFDDKLCFLQAYWSVFREFLPEAFKSKEEGKDKSVKFGKRFPSNIGKKNGKTESKEDGKKEKKYLLLTSLGIHSVHRIARDILHSAIQEAIDFRREELLKEKLMPIKSFDWNAATSRLSALGGMKGVSKAYELLSAVLGQENGVPIAEQSLGNYIAKSSIDRPLSRDGSSVQPI
jgi:DGQHR domain-containing protein